jgi:hypothetical protein
MQARFSKNLRSKNIVVIQKKYPFNSVYFVWSRWGGVPFFPCLQGAILCEEKFNLKPHVLSTSDIELESANIKNSLIFTYKAKINEPFISILKDNDNIVVSNPGDIVSLSALLDFISQSKATVTTLYSQEAIEKVSNNLPNYKFEKILPNYDLFLDKKTFKNQRNSNFSIFYGGMKKGKNETQGELGLNLLKDYKISEGYFFTMKAGMELEKTSCSLLNYGLNIADKGLCETMNQLISSDENPSKYSLHYSVRSKHLKDGSIYEQWLSKPAIKLATAAGSGSNIIQSLDPSARELINEDYPYAIDTSTKFFVDNYQEICYKYVCKAKETFGTKIWQDGLNIMKDVEKKTNMLTYLTRILDIGEKYFK